MFLRYWTSNTEPSFWIYVYEMLLFVMALQLVFFSYGGGTVQLAHILRRELSVSFTASVLMLN